MHAQFLQTLKSQLKLSSVSSRVTIMKAIVLLIVIQMTFGSITKQYQNTLVSEYKTIFTFSASSKIACGVACLINNDCEGFNFDGLSCSLLYEILRFQDGHERGQVWIDPEIQGTCIHGIHKM